MTDTLTRHSPLYDVYRRENAECEQVAGWRIARHFGDADAEARRLKQDALLVDWSHIGKVSIRGGAVVQEVSRLDPRAADLVAGQSLRLEHSTVLRLTQDEFFILCPPDGRQDTVGAVDPAAASVVDMTGAMGCLVLAGPRRDEVMERSSAMDLRRDRVGDFAVVQTTVHTVPVILYRARGYDLLLTTRDYVEFLFDALMDVGRGVGLRPGGLAALAVDLGASA